MRAASSSGRGPSGDQTPLWREILSGSARSTSGLECNTLVMLGDEGVGKDALIQALRSSPGPDSNWGIAMEYTHMDFAHEDDGDLPPRLNVWQLSDRDQSALLKFALNPLNFQRTVAMVVVDFSQPWTFLDSLRGWLEILEAQILAAYDACPETGLDRQHQDRMVSFFQSYKEPPKDASASPKSGGFAEDGLAGGEDILLPLRPGTLTKNLGLPIVFVCNKTDMMASLENGEEYQDSDFDFIQQHLRTIALEYGATLVYTSSKHERGVDLLHEYIAHRLFGAPFRHRADVLDKETVFVPCGYDSMEKIKVLEDEYKQGSYNEVIAPPKDKTRAFQKADEVAAEKDQEFLKEMQKHLEAAGSGKSVARARPTVDPVVEIGGGGVMGSPSTMAGAGLGGPGTPSGPGTPASSLTPGSSAMLQNFFESLMKSDGKESNDQLLKGVQSQLADEKKRAT